ncbi:MAG: ABC transporter ATP-binding protein [Nitrospinae bacterium]|nr:ABC transporter ATP-binding protein [Nitrospinota bacterium]
MPSVMVNGAGIVKKFGSFTAVAGVDFSVMRGECFGFLGPNGAGKTSVMRMIQCLSPIDEGSITVDGMAAGKDDREIKAILGVAPQEESLDPDLSVMKNLVVFAGYFDIPRKTAEDKARALLDFFHLTQWRNHKIRALSGGMRRRLVIARALINDPSILILDEPTTGLDPSARLVIWRKLAELKRSGVTMILTTHYMEEAMRLCGRVAIMRDGRIMLTGEPERLIHEQLGDAVTELVCREGFESAAEEAISRTGLRFERMENSFVIFGPADGELDAIMARNGELGFVKTRRAPNLEDLFIKLTHKGHAGAAEGR